MPANPWRCQGRTAKGTPCTRYNWSAGYCKAHQSQVPEYEFRFDGAGNSLDSLVYNVVATLFEFRHGHHPDVYEDGEAFVTFLRWCVEHTEHYAWEDGGHSECPLCSESDDDDDEDGYPVVASWSVPRVRIQP